MSLTRLFRIVNGLLLALVLVVLWRFAGQEWAAFTRVREGAQALSRLQQTLWVGEAVSAEQAPSLALMAQGARHAPELLPGLRLARQRTDQALDRLDTQNLTVANAVSRARLVIDEVRRSVDAASRLPQGVRSQDAAGELARLREAAAQMLPLMDGYTALALESYPERYAAIQGAQSVAALVETADALAASLRLPLVARRPLWASEREEVARLQARIALLHEELERQLEPLDAQPALTETSLAVRQGYFGRAQVLIQQALSTDPGGAPVPPLDAHTFADRYQAEQQALLTLRDLLIDDALRHADQRSQAAWGAMVLAGVLLLVLGIGLGGLMWLLNHRVFRPLAQAAEAINAMASGRHELDMPAVAAHDEVGAVMGALQKLQDSQRQAARLGTERDALIHKLRSLSTTDPLTGLLNRRAFFESAEREQANAERHGFDLAVVLLDIDHFKSINDTHGHGVGDRALVAVAGALQGAMRQGDLVARYGGEEFVLLLLHCARVPGLGLAERLRASVAELSLNDATGGAFSLTASLGVASSSDLGLDLSTLLSQADAAMYRAKRRGRNQVDCLQNEESNEVDSAESQPGGSGSARPVRASLPASSLSAA